MRSWVDLTIEEKERYKKEFNDKKPNEEIVYKAMGWVTFTVLIFLGIRDDSLASLLIPSGFFCGILSYCGWLSYTKKREKEFIKWLAVSKHVVK